MQQISIFQQALIVADSAKAVALNQPVSLLLYNKRLRDPLLVLAIRCRYARKLSKIISLMTFDFNKKGLFNSICLHIADTIIELQPLVRLYLIRCNIMVVNNRGTVMIL